MPKLRTQFLCNNCGSVQAKWFGKCPDCNTWDSLEAYRPPVEDKRRPGGSGGGLGGDGGGRAGVFASAEAQRLDEITTDATDRIATGLSEFDRILGGGIVPGSATLVGGEPGIGKSTLLLQVAGLLAGSRSSNDDLPSLRKHSFAKSLRPVSSNHAVTQTSPAAPADRGRDQGAENQVDDGVGAGISHGVSVMYVTSEESARQTKLRAERIGINSPKLRVLAETNLERIRQQVEKHRPDVVIVDSIQMVYKPDLPAAPGSVTQLRDGCMELVYLAKSTGTAVIVVGHVTKAGTLAGPKIIEHIVDTVIYFEGDRFHSHRIVRCIKNRFGSTHEVGIFEMTGDGLREVADPSSLFVHAHGQATSGTLLTAAMQGTRVMMLEVQALTASSVIGAARRKSSGVSMDRVAMILAVLEKRCDLRLAADDVFVNIAGGVKVVEPAVDLAVALAIASAHLNRAIPPGTLAIGELGLGGEIRPVPQIEARLKEASRLGASQAIIPPIGNTLPKLNGMALHEVRRISQALAAL